MPEVPSGHVSDSWRVWSDRMAALGHELGGEPFPAGGAVEGVRHLAQQVVCWLGWEALHDDPATPMFQRQNDLVTQWGGPNVDNLYRHARIDPAGTYRIRGRMHSCEEFLLAVRAGFMHRETWGTLNETSATDFGIGAGDEFELILSATPQNGNWVRLDPGAVMVSIREYYFDWQPAEPATFVIERLDDAPPARLTEDRLTHALAEAADEVERSLRYWNDYLVRHRAELGDNQVGPPSKVGKGLEAASYGFVFWRLGPDEALVLDTEVPDARYWSFQLYRLGWFEAFDHVHRQTSLNHRQARVDDDGRVRVVLAHRDPGVPNWLDGEGRDGGLLTYRWFWSATQPLPTGRVVPVDEVRALLPADTPVVDATARAATVAARRAHIAWRYRT